MPKHTQNISIEITPERFLDLCSDYELKELDLLIQSERYQKRIRNQGKVVIPLDGGSIYDKLNFNSKNKDR